MAFTLNTSHALYPNLVELIGVDPATGTLSSAKTARTFTAQSGATYPTTAGTYGKPARTNPASSIGAFSFAPAVEISNTAMTLVVVTNSISLSGGTAPYQLVSSLTERNPMVAVTGAGKAAFAYSYGNTNTLALGTTTVTSGARVLAITHGSAGSKVYVDGALEGSNATVLDPQTATYSNIGGIPGFNAVAIDFVWAAWFDRVLTDAEIASLTSSVQANNVIGLLNGAPAGGTPTVSSVTVSPATPTVSGSTTQQFTATVAGTNNPGQGVTWAASAGTINSSGLFTAPAATASSQSITITATSTVDNTKSGTATVTVPATGAPPVTYTGVSVSPSTATVVGLATRQFTATVSGTGAFSTTVTWSVDGGSANGTINSSGLYTAPAAGVSARNIVVRAVAADGTTAGTAAVTVPAAAGSGSFTSARLRNGSGGYQINQSVRYEWHPGARIGQSSGNVFQEGVGTTDAQGRLAMTGLTAGTGYFLFARWNNSVTDDHVSFQAGTVS